LFDFFTLRIEKILKNFFKMETSQENQFQRANRNEVNADNALISKLHEIVNNKFHVNNQHLTFEEFMKLLIDHEFLKNKSVKVFPKIAKKYNISEESRYTTRQINYYFQDLIPFQLRSYRRFISICLWTLIILKDSQNICTDPILPFNINETIKNLQRIIEKSELYLRSIKDRDMIKKYSYGIEDISSFYIDYITNQNDTIVINNYVIIDRFYNLLSKKIPGKKTKTLFTCLTDLFFPKQISRFFSRTIYGIIIDFHLYKNEKIEEVINDNLSPISEKKEFIDDKFYIVESSTISDDIDDVYDSLCILDSPVTSEEIDDIYDSLCILDSPVTSEENEVINIIDSFLPFNEPSFKKIRI